jgi:hypothetical protein
MAYDALEYADWKKLINEREIRECSLEEIIYWWAW